MFCFGCFFVGVEKILHNNWKNERDQDKIETHQGVALASTLEPNNLVIIPTVVSTSGPSNSDKKLLSVADGLL